MPPKDHNGTLEEWIDMYVEVYFEGGKIRQFVHHHAMPMWLGSWTDVSMDKLLACKTGAEFRQLLETEAAIARIK